MNSEAHFVLNALRDLQLRAEAAAKRHPGLRHMLVLPPGEGIRVPSPSGVRPLGTKSGKQQRATRKFGETELVGPLPPRTGWPKGIEPFRAVVAGEKSSPHHPYVQELYRIHLIFDGSNDAFNCLQELADDLDGIQADVTRALFGDDSPTSRSVFYISGNCLHDAKAARLDSWLCTVHWWAWFWTESPIRTRPQVVHAGSPYETDPRDDAVKSKLAFSMFDADVLTASATTLSLILRFFDDPPARSWSADYPPVPEVEDVLQSGQPGPKNSFAKLADWNALTDRQRNCIRALFELNAFDADSRRDAKEVAVKAEGYGANVNGFKEPLADLVRRGLAESKIGRQGGFWLTDHGRRLLAVADSQGRTDSPSS